MLTVRRIKGLRAAVALVVKEAALRDEWMAGLRVKDVDRQEQLTFAAYIQQIRKKQWASARIGGVSVELGNGTKFNPEGKRARFRISIMAKMARGRVHPPPTWRQPQVNYDGFLLLM